MTRYLAEHFKVISDFYAKWLSVLSALVARSRLQERPWRILLLRSGDGFQILENRGGAVVRLGETKPADGTGLPAKAALALRTATKTSAPIVLRLSPDEVVERTIQIPQGARDVIEPVLRNQMNRIVPWAQEETCFGFTVAGANRNSPEQLDVRLAVTTRGVLDAAIAELRDLGITPTAVDMAPPEEMGRGILLQSLTPDPTLRIAQRLHLSLAVLSVLCLVVSGAGFYRLWQAETERRDLEARIALLRTHLAEAGTQNDQGADAQDTTDRLMRRKASEPAVVGLIEALSRAIPDNSFLTELELRTGLVRMVGKSSDASALIAVIENAPHFDHVSFAAPTTKEPGDSMESFTITTQIAGAASPEEKHEPAE